MTSNDLKRPQSISESSLEVKLDKSKNKLKGGANVESNNPYLDEFLRKDHSEMYLAMQIISNDKTVRSNTVQDLKEFISQCLAT